MSSEKNVSADGTGPPLGSPIEEEPDNGDSPGTKEEEEEEATNGRTLYFNQPLPSTMLDEEGHPILDFPRNKIRTAKYTALSFVPKNLWFQFHNVANIFFLFLIILVVSG